MHVNNSQPNGETRSDVSMLYKVRICAKVYSKNDNTENDIQKKIVCGMQVSHLFCCVRVIHRAGLIMFCLYDANLEYDTERYSQEHICNCCH